MAEELEQARNALKAFMSVINRWETRFYRAKRDTLEANRDTMLIDDEARRDLAAILEKWAFPERENQWRLIDLGCIDPPTYDPSGDVEEKAEVERNEVVFVLRQTKGLQNKFRFTTKHQAGEWKIKKKEILNYRDEWQRSVHRCAEVRHVSTKHTKGRGRAPSFIQAAVNSELAAFDGDFDAQTG